MTATGNTTRLRRAKGLPARQAGFTLVELTVVLSLLLLLAGVALPSIVELFSAGSAAQAYNLFDGQIKSARAHAIGTGNYTGVHVQMATGTERGGMCYTAVVEYNWDAAKLNFGMAGGFMPHRMPGNIAVGELSEDFLDGSEFEEIPDGTADVQGSFEDMTTFTIAFAPNGSVTRYVHGEEVIFDPADPLFAGLWGLPPDEVGATAVIFFDYTKMAPRTEVERKDHLDETAEFIPINIHSGQLFHRD